MTSYGEQAAEKLIDEYAVCIMAALAGDLEALQLLLKVAAQSGYTAGIAEAAKTVGVTL